MNISYNWLKEYVPTTLSAQEVADALTSIGLETGGVEEVQSIKGGLEGLVVGHVLTCVEHPNSDHLHITTVDLGGEEPVQIVCGAPNVAAGQKVVVATVGTVLYDGDSEFKIKKGKIRGEVSLGMICAEDEIGVGTSHEGIINLPADTKVGMKAADYYGVSSDYLIEVDITPNHADACSHYGVARDFYAYLVQNGHEASISRPSVDAFKVANEDLKFEVEVENTEACPRYAAVSMKGVQVGPSPKWLQDKLNIVGIRPINNVVDVTNYICHAYGQPMHCFDAKEISSGTIRVKTLAQDTPFVTLDEVERKLDGRDLMICNDQEPMCIAGVFGGLASGAKDDTTDIVLESAYFHPTWVRKSARRHGLNTDSSFRFERGIDPLNTIYCLKRAALLIQEMAGGEVSSQIINKQAQEFPYFRVDLAYSKVNSLIGKDIPVETVKSICTSLEMIIVEETAEGIVLDVPPYRVDVQRDVDVIEDILRVYGYNNVEMPTTLKSVLTTKTPVDRSHKLQNLVSEQLVGAGYQEIMNNSLTRAAFYDALETFPRENCVMLINPLSQDLNAMRQTMLFGGLQSIAHNVKRREQNLRLFEVGNCYYFNKAKHEGDEAILSGYSEDNHLAIWSTGNRVSGSWAHADEANTFFEVKAEVFNIFRRVGLANGQMVISEQFSNDLFAAALEIKTRGDKTLATLGIVKTSVAEQFDIEQMVSYADINWTEMMKQVRNHTVSSTEVSKFPAVKRDLALLLDATVPFAEVERIALQSDKKLLKAVTLFDVYEGKNLPAGKKSYAVNFTLLDETKTLNDKAIDKVMNKIIQNLTKQLNAELR